MVNLDAKRELELLTRAKQAAETFSVLILTTFVSLLHLPFDSIPKNCVTNAAKTNMYT